jgi:hypothetical protein
MCQPPFLAAHPTARAYPGLQVDAKLFGIHRREVNLVLDTVEGERDGLVGRRLMVEVVDLVSQSQFSPWWSPPF